MIRLFLRALTATLGYLWSGWGAIASLLLFCGVWELISQLYGDFILPSPTQSIQYLWVMLSDPETIEQLIITAKRALMGLSLALLVGGVLGMLAGFSITTSIISRPLVTIFLGMPPIAWLVLAMIWFGLGDATAVFTVFIACVPIVFAGAMQGTRTLDNKLNDLSKVYKLPLFMRITDIYLPHLASYMFPSWVTALGTSWKVVVMAELLSTSDGVGAALGVSRAQLDTTGTMAWVLAVLLILLAFEYLFLEPIKQHIERWRIQDT